MRFNLSNDIDENSIYKNDEKSSNDITKKENIFGLENNLINNQIINLINQDDRIFPRILKFSPSKKEPKTNIIDSNLDNINNQKNYCDYLPRNNPNKISNSDSKNLQSMMDPLNCGNFSTYNYNVNNVNKCSQISNNFFFPNNNKFINFNFYNPAFSKIPQSQNMNMNFYNYNNYLLPYNINSNLMHANFKIYKNDFNRNSYTNQFADSDRKNSISHGKIQIYFFTEYLPIFLL